ncbi:MAG TPA: hypothetical protein VK869_02545 [Rubrobacteraceae bacterium]|nr:hypothetical protein [Rubrobacteraceae bacterium]
MTTTSVIDATTELGSYAPGGSGERTLSLLLATREVRDSIKRTHEDAAIDEEDILTQDEEALVLG